MIDEADAIEETIFGLVTFCREHPNIPKNYRIFWLKADKGRGGRGRDGKGSDGFCKGNLLNNKRIEVGARLKLTGKWFTDPKYPTYENQFHFYDCEFIAPQAASQFSSNETPIPGKQAERPYEEVRGHILRFIYHEGNSRIFRLRSIDGNEFDCVGYLTSGKEIFEDNKLRLTGTWEYSQKYHRLQFQYKFYEVIPPGKPDKFIIRRKNNALGSRNTEYNPLPRLTLFLKDIGAKKVTYEFHTQKRASIAAHVWEQLDKRIINSNSSSTVAKK